MCVPSATWMRTLARRPGRGRNVGVDVGCYCRVLGMPEYERRDRSIDKKEGDRLCGDRPGAREEEELGDSRAMKSGAGLWWRSRATTWCRKRLTNVRSSRASGTRRLCLRRGGLP